MDDMPKVEWHMIKYRPHFKRLLLDTLLYFGRNRSGPSCLASNRRHGIWCIDRLYYSARSSSQTGLQLYWAYDLARLRQSNGQLRHIENPSLIAIAGA